MPFNSYSFLFLFLPFALVGFALLARTGHCGRFKIFLLIASLVYIALSGFYNALVLAISIGVNFFVYTRLISVEHKKCWLSVGLLLDIAALAVFKYLNCLAMPIGISFYTFQMIAFLVDCYREQKIVTFLDFALFGSFFPKFLQGPIPYASEMLPQFDKDNSGLFSWDNLANGLFLFSLGLAKKVLVADTLGKIVDYGYAHIASLNSYEALLAVIGYSFQLYFDFSGYCDMASGVARMFNIELPVNFNSPYKARNISDFWNRWHITLTRFLTKYIYIPLGGNRKGLKRALLNILIVFFISGIWHGTGWTFIIWGLMHGIATVLYKLFYKHYDKIPNVLQWLINFGFVTIAWVFFRADSASDAFAMIRQVFAGGWSIAVNSELTETLLQPALLSILNRIVPLRFALIFLYGIIALACVKFSNTNRISKCFTSSIGTLLVSGVLIVYCVLSFSGVTTFLYVNF